MKRYKKVTVGFVIQEYVETPSGYECVSQEFTASDDVSREDDDMGDPVDVDTSKEQYCPFNMKEPRPTEIRNVIRNGELEIDPDEKIVDVEEAVDQCCNLMDAASTWDILGSPLFQGENGEFYTITLTAEVGKANLQVVEQELDDLLDSFDLDEQTKAEQLEWQGLTLQQRVEAKLEMWRQAREDQNVKS